MTYILYIQFVPSSHVIEYVKIYRSILQVHLLDDLAQFIAGTISDELKEILDEKVENDTLLKKMEEKISRIQTDAETVRTDIDGVKVTDELKNLNDAIVYATDVEYFR